MIGSVLHRARYAARRVFGFLSSSWAPGGAGGLKGIDGDSRAWPGRERFALSGPVSQALDATVELWGFLADKGR